MSIRILVSTDGSDLSEKAVDAAVELASKFGAELVGVTCVPNVLTEDDVDQAVLDRLLVVERKAEDKKVAYKTVVKHSETVWQGILDCADEFDASYIVMSSRGLGSIGSLLLGSETQKVLHQATRPVLIVR